MSKFNERCSFKAGTCFLQTETHKLLSGGMSTIHNNQVFDNKCSYSSEESCYNTRSLSSLRKVGLFLQITVSLFQGYENLTDRTCMWILSDFFQIFSFSLFHWTHSGPAAPTMFLIIPAEQKYNVAIKLLPQALCFTLLHLGKSTCTPMRVMPH